MSYYTIKHIKGNPYLYEVHSERNGDQVRQVFDAYLGRADGGKPATRPASRHARRAAARSEGVPFVPMAVQAEAISPKVKIDTAPKPLTFEGFSPTQEKQINEMVNRLPFDIKPEIRGFRVNKDTKIGEGEYLPSGMIEIISPEELTVVHLGRTTLYHEIGHDYLELLMRNHPERYDEYAKALFSDVPSITSEEAKRFILTQAFREHFADSFAYYVENPTRLNNSTKQFFEKYLPKVAPTPEVVTPKAVLTRLTTEESDKLAYLRRKLQGMKAPVTAEDKLAAIEDAQGAINDALQELKDAAGDTDAVAEAKATLKDARQELAEAKSGKGISTGTPWAVRDIEDEIYVLEKKATKPEVVTPKAET